MNRDRQFYWMDFQEIKKIYNYGTKLMGIKCH